MYDFSRMKYMSIYKLHVLPAFQGDKSLSKVGQTGCRVNISLMSLGAERPILVNLGSHAFQFFGNLPELAFK